MRSPIFFSIFWLGTACAYTLKTDYTGDNYADFFNKFSFWTSSDPTNGYVDYVDQATSLSNGLIGTGGNIYIGVDHTNVASGRGRKSVRLTSTESYDVNTLFVVDIAHMPQTCGTWPSFWTTATTSTWPQQGEVDIIEQANNAQNNQMSLHISNKQGSCVASSSSQMTAKKDRWGDCTQEAQGGCDANDPRTTFFGSGFNNNGGGVYAMEWTASHVRIWFFPRNSIPNGTSGPLGSSPVPSRWGTPTTSFEGCDFDAHIKKQHIVIDTTFCGD
ncbi:Concanavalin A-like lectin glucanases superfamily [Fusarium beomiforme]|uniref:Concanavalin A-like lectin glucanases superfamily n=1 Tax=Fusarium beomiforme TaxID=44412 RepID=A0A9P5ACF8_9HYPO|nr:Concanavalin A-like lectin glucanases superfamily [Fusarium beomiforme]